MKSDILIYEDTPRYDRWMTLVLGGLSVLTLLAGFAFLFIETGAAYVFFGVTVFDGLLFWSVIPRRNQLFEDQVRIVLGGPFAVNIPLADIRTIARADRSLAFVYWGLRLVTSLDAVTEITRRNGLNVVFSPSDPEAFIEQVNLARDALRSNVPPSAGGE